jgi:hypothetical protein
MPDDGLRFKATRKNRQDWHSLARKIQNDKSIESTSIPWNDLVNRNKLLNSVIAWPDYATIQSIYTYIRDLRYFTDIDNSHFKRRITWLYPDEGCWSRAAAFIKDFFGSINNPVATFHRPSKIFAFGNLCVNTKNNSDGYVSWWVHIAPVIRDNQTNAIYVLDPAVEPKHPLPVTEWITKIADNTGACADELHTITKINICNGYGIVPWDVCDTAPASQESYAMLEQMLHMKHEKSMQIQIGNDPIKTLGDSPPWLKN